MSTTVAITLGHADLFDSVHAIDPHANSFTVSRNRARQAVEHSLTYAGATVLTRAEGEGEWEGERETCDVWLAVIPEAHDVGYLADGLARIAQRFGQDALGFLVHDHQTRPNSYVASPTIPTCVGCDAPVPTDEYYSHDCQEN